MNLLRAAWPFLAAGLLVPMLAVSGSEAGVTECADLAAWVDRLASDDVSERREAYEALLAAGLRAPEAVRAVLPADAADPEVRAACRQLEEAIERERLRAQILEAVGGHPSGREAAQAFFEAPDRERLDRLWEAVPADRKGPLAGVLRHYLAHPDPFVRGRTALALAEGAPEGAAAAIGPLLADGHPGVRAEAICTLTLLKDRSIVRQLPAFIVEGPDCVRHAAAYAGRMLAGTPDIPSILPLLKHGDPSVRTAAWQILTGVDAPEARAAVVAALADTDPNVRMEACRLLGQSWKKEALPHLARFLEDPDPGVRGVVLDFLGEHGGTDLMARVLAQIAEESQVRFEAMKCLARIGKEEATPHLLPYLRSRNADLRMNAVQALGFGGDRSVIPGLMLMIETCDEKDRSVYGYAAGRLAGIPWPDNERGMARLAAWWETHKDDPEFSEGEGKCASE